MKRLRSHRLLVAAILAASVLTTAQMAHAGPEAPPVPGDINVAEGNKPFLVGHATGVQVYRCNAVAGGYRWGFVAPRANLYDDSGKLLTTHFGGPTWQARDGSYVVARLDARITVDATAIAWLRLAATSSAAGPDGGRLAGTTFIQRIATTGGLEPAPADCNAGTAGETSEIPYTADYVFWKATGS